MTETEEESSLGELLRKRELYQHKPPIYDEGCNETEVPFHLLEGESPLFMDLFLDNHLLVLTNYRLFVTQEEGFYSLPVGLIERVEQRHPSDLALVCRTAKIIRLKLDSARQCQRWFERMRDAINPPVSFRNVFAFVHYAYCTDSPGVPAQLMWPSTKDGIKAGKEVTGFNALLMSEYQRMGLDKTKTWRITECNTKYQLCPSYPKLFVVPKLVSDSELQQVVSFRSGGRVPAVVWRHQQNGAVIARCSQPMIGVLHWRCQEDEKLLKALSEASVLPAESANQPPVPNGTLGRSTNADIGEDARSALSLLVVMDLRSYTAAFGNRAKGGGSEHQDYYTNCEILYKGLPNIHSVRKSFHSLRSLMSSTDEFGFLSTLEGTQWLHYVSQLLLTSVEVMEVVEEEGRPVLVHCSDGWDRTTQVVSLAQILMDPHYRTIKGFQTLVEKEWLSFGHKFADRSGQAGVDGDQSPVFLQWLDCVHQIAVQFPTAFEFSCVYLVKLAHHCYTRLFGTFLVNCEQEREEERVSHQTLSVWPFLEVYVNVLYARNEAVLYPKCSIRSMRLWRDLYCSESLIPYYTGHPPAPIVSLQPGHTHCGHTPNGTTALLTTYVNGTAANKEVSPTNVLDFASSSDESGPDNKRAGWNQSASPVYIPSPASPLHATLDVEESFRVVDEDSGEPSLTTNMLSSDNGIQGQQQQPDCAEQKESNGGFVSSRGSAGPGRLGSELSDLSSVPSADNEADKENALSYSVYSLCESRLRNLGLDGMEITRDHVHRVVTDLSAVYQKQIAELQVRLRQLALLHKNKAAVSAELYETQDSVPLTANLLDRQSTSSPVGEWTYVEEKDTQGVQWVPDHAVNNCQNCGAAFWMGRRKHHCRSCGKVFCWMCSNYFCPVPREQLYCNQRVCKSCFDQLDGFLKRDSQDVT